MSKGLGKALEYSTIHVVRNGTYRCRPPIPLNDSVLAHLLHDVRLDPNPANGSVNSLLPFRSQVQVFVLSLTRIQFF